MVTGAQSESRKAAGCFSTPEEGGALIMNGRKQQDRRKRKPVCCLKSLPSLSLFLSVYASSLRSLHLGVIRVLAGRMISCHPQWWPSTA